MSLGHGTSIEDRDRVVMSLSHGNELAHTDDLIRLIHHPILREDPNTNDYDYDYDREWQSCFCVAELKNRPKLPVDVSQDNDKKNILAVQSIRNAIMASSLMATTSILLCSGLAAVISSTYSIKKPLDDALFGAHGEFMVSLKYVTLLLIFLFAFLCYSLSIRFVNQVNFLINTPCCGHDGSPVTPQYVCDLLEKGFFLNTVGNRLFYAALPLLLWIFGPVLVPLSSLTMIPILYNLDTVCEKGKSGFGVETEERDEADIGV
ncbi:hypothetical protein GW17_00060075 [Ensete ventricosum]|nr:hypothetical protein GW17_00060075 [Ensete ventricosum]